MIRAGVIVPQSNAANEVEFNRLAPHGLSFHFARIPLHKDFAHKSNLDTISQRLRGGAADLGSCDCEIIVLGCTSDSMAFGTVVRLS